MKPLPVHCDGHEIRVGRHFSVNFQRTLRIPDDGRSYPLPPGFGAFPLRPVEEYADRVPEYWRETGGYFLPMYQREALWLSFRGSDWHPVAVQVGAGSIDAVAGSPFEAALCGQPQNYVVVPAQPWLDGIKAGEEYIRQFVAAPLGMGVTIEEQVSGLDTGGIRIAVIEPRAGLFPDEQPQGLDRQFDGFAYMVCEKSARPLGLAAGGRMRQKVYPDTHPVGTWDESTRTVVHVHIADSRAWREITGEPIPPTPISFDIYRRSGLPWFKLHDEGQADVPATETLAGVESLEQIALTLD